MSNIRGIATDYQQMIGSERPPHPETKRLERAAADEIADVQLIVRRRPDGPALKDLDYFQKVPINARNLPSRLEFQEAHGATQADLDAVQEFCRSHGLRVVESNRSRRRVAARGTVAQLNAAFAVELHHYQSPHGKYRGYQGTASLPTALDGIVQAVNGLDNRPVPVKHLSADPPIVGLLSPPQVAQLYNFPSGTGLGQTIGIFTAWVAAPMGVQPTTNTNGYQLADVTVTLAKWGVVAPPPTDFPAGSNPGSPTEYYSEPVMDIAIAAAIAPQASIFVYFMPEWSAAGIISTLTSMIHPATASDPHPAVISISYWFSADDDDTSFLLPQDYTQIDTLFQEAANLGITVLTGSNDYGAYFSSTTQAQTVYPATDPYVLTCGGTTIGDISGSDFDEYVWNDTWTSANGTASGATGGGISALFPVPPYQATINTLPTRNGTGAAGRGIPDVAGNASPNSGYVITLNQNTFPPNPPGGTGVGGTSIVAPLYAGLVALINETLGENVGFLNPTIYALAPAICRDVTGAAGPTNNNYNGVTGYPAGVGWDACTGWGSIDGSALLSLLQGIFQKSMTFIMERTTFGPDEVTATGGVFEQAFFVVVDGLKPSDFPGGGITTTSLTPPPTQGQLNQWAPVIPSPTGPGGVATNITFTPTAVSSEGPSLSPEVQRFTFTYRVTFPNQTAFTMFPALDFPLLLTLNASLAATGGIPDAAAQIELIQGGDPYFSSESNGGLYWLNEDIRVFYAIEGSTLFGYPAPGLGSTPAAPAVLSNGSPRICRVRCGSARMATPSRTPCRPRS
jgi:kumamolisin